MEPLLITTCTSRKRISSSPSLKAATLPKGNLQFLLKEWLRRLNAQHVILPILDLYTSRGFYEIKKLSHQMRAPLYVISAGLGLKESKDQVPSYDLTIARKDPNSIKDKLDEGDFDTALWWNGINREHGPNPISKLVRSAPNKLFIITLNSSYWDMVKKDLSSLEKKELSRVRITGLEVEKVPPHLRHSILPYDTRFDGPDSPLPGTRSDFPQRTCVHYVGHVLPKFGLKKGDAKIIELMENMRYPRIVRRKRLGDEEIIRLMLNLILKKRSTSAEMLRYLRDDKKVACEQSRCSQLYKISLERSNGA